MGKIIKNNMRRQGVRYRIIERADDRLIDDGRKHEVALVEWTVVRPDKTKATGTEIRCECDFPANPKLPWIDSEKCVSKFAFRLILVHRLREANAARWKAMNLKEQVMDIYGRHKAGEYLGQHHSGLLYTQEVAELLDVTEEKMLTACAELFAEDRLDLNGCVLIDWEPRFRFPEEIRHALAYMIEAPLGWPNGDAGDCFLGEIEGAITEGTDLKHGRDTFGYGGNYPHLNPWLLLELGASWLVSGLEQIKQTGDAEQTKKATKYLERIGKRLGLEPSRDSKKK